MRVIDSHFHWFPRSVIDQFARHLREPRFEPRGDGYLYYGPGGIGPRELSSVWFELDGGLDALGSAFVATPVTAVGTAGILSGLCELLSPPVALEVAKTFNEELSAAQRDSSGRFVGTAMIPLSEVSEATYLLEYAAVDLDLRGVNMPPITDSDTGHLRRLDPFFAMAADLGVPLIVHPTDLAFGHDLDDHDGELQRSLGRLMDSSVTVLRLVLAGVMERHPRLKIVQTHAGALLPYQAGRIDKNSSDTGLSKPPSEYLKGVYVDTVAPQPSTIGMAADFYGDDHVIFGTDHPCWSAQVAVETVHDAGLGSTSEDCVFFHNSKMVFGLPTEPTAAATASP